MYPFTKKEQKKHPTNIGIFFVAFNGHNALEATRYNRWQLLIKCYGGLIQYVRLQPGEILMKWQIMYCRLEQTT